MELRISSISPRTGQRVTNESIAFALSLTREYVEAFAARLRAQYEANGHAARYGVRVEVEN